MTVSEVAKELGKSNQWVLNRIHDGRLKATQISPKKWSIDGPDVAALLGGVWFK